MPTAIGPGMTAQPLRSTAAAKKSCGISTWMPAPSPVLPSASTAPRCQTAFRAAMRGFDHVAAALSVERTDEANAAGIVFLGRIVGVVQGGGVGLARRRGTGQRTRGS